MMDESSSSSGVCGIKKLRGVEDFPDWKFQVRNYLENKDWYKVIEADKIDDTLKDTDRKAKTTICLLLEPSCFTHVYDAKTAKEVWESLMRAYEDKGWGRRITLQRKLWGCKLEDFESMEKYIARVIFLARQLSDINAKVPDDWIISILLMGLTEDYNPLIMSVDNSSVAISLENIKTKLLQEAYRQKETSSSNDLVLAVNTKRIQLKGQSNKQNFDRKPLKCFKCKKFGHKATDCTVKKQNSHKHTASICMNANDTTEPNSKNWYLDSGCSNHMCHDKNKLFGYKVETTKEHVKVANGQELSVTGYGTALPQVSADTKLTLENVWHVPDLTMNLISVSKLAEKNYAINFDKRSCTIKKDN